LYVALVRGEAVTPLFAGKTLRLVEWDVRLERGEPDTVVNETWALLSTTIPRPGVVWLSQEP